MKETQDYNEVARQFEEYMCGAVTEWTLGYPAVKALIEPMAGKRVLDYGCGGGNFSKYLNECGAGVTGVDVSSNMIDCACAEESSVRFMVLPEGGLAEASIGNFDAAVLNFVLCTMPSGSDVVKTLRQIHAVLNTNGMCIALNTNWEKCNGSNFASFRLDEVSHLKSGAPIGLFLKSDPPVRIEDYFWSQADYVAFFQEAGFCRVAVHEITAAAAEANPRWIDEARTSPFFIVTGYKSA